MPTTRTVSRNAQHLSRGCGDVGATIGRPIELASARAPPLRRTDLDGLVAGTPAESGVADARVGRDVAHAAAGAVHAVVKAVRNALTALVEPYAAPLNMGELYRNGAVSYARHRARGRIERLATVS
jgi:hypothetical protein